MAFKKDVKKVREVSEFEFNTIALNRVVKVVKGGRTLRFAAHVICGNRKGQVGYGSGKAKEVPVAIEKAQQAAKKNLITINTVNGTIPHQASARFGSSKVLIMPAKAGNGIIAGGAVRPIAELSGINNITTKTLGSRNAINVAKAALMALEQLKTAEQIAEIRKPVETK